MNHMHQDSPRGASGGSSPQLTSSLIQSMGDILMEDAETLIDTSNQTPIASITLECHQLFKETLANIQQSDEHDIFETQYGRLNIWASNIGAVVKDKSSLDYRLRLSDDIKSMILQLLEVLKGSLRQALDEGGDPNRRTQVFGEVIEAASASLDRLQNLATVIRKSSAQSRNLRSKALSSDDELNFKDFVLRVLKHRFKEANGSLCEQVAESVALRRKQFEYKIRHQGKLARPVVELGHSNLRPEPSMAGTKHHLVAPQRNYGEINTATREPKRLRLIAPLGRPCAVAPSETNASTLDTKLFRKTFPVHKAPRSIASQGTSVRDVDLEYPPPPALALEHRECTCPYCCEILLSVHTKNERWWRHHIDTDLEPYSCISEKCRSSSTQFAKFQDWAQHMATHGSSNIAWGVHLKMFHCPLCESLEPFRWKEDFTSHMNTHHAERFTSAQLLTLSRRSTITVIRGPHVCPFCNRMPEEIEKITPLNRDKMTELLPRHIAGHLRSLAFMALPCRDDIKDYESNAGRNQSGEGSATSRRISNLDSDNELEEFWTNVTTGVQEQDVFKELKFWKTMEEVENMEKIRHLYHEDNARPPSRSSTQHGWDFLPSRSEEYHIEEDPLIQKFIASQGEINRQSSSEQVQASDLELNEGMPLYMKLSSPKRTDGGDVDVTSQTDYVPSGYDGWTKNYVKGYLSGLAPHVDYESIVSPVTASVRLASRAASPVLAALSIHDKTNDSKDADLGSPCVTRLSPCVAESATPRPQLEFSGLEFPSPTSTSNYGFGDIGKIMLANSTNITEAPLGNEYLPFPQDTYARINRPRSQIHHCPRCALELPNLESFGDHMARVHGRKAFECPEPGCHVAYLRGDSLMRHITDIHSVKADDGFSARSIDTIVLLRKLHQEAKDRHEEGNLKSEDSERITAGHEGEIDDVFEKTPSPQQHISTTNNETLKSETLISRDDKNARAPDILLPSFRGIFGLGYPPRDRTLGTPAPDISLPSIRNIFTQTEEFVYKPGTKPAGQSSTGTQIIPGPISSITTITSQREQFTEEKLVYTCSECSATFSNKKLLRAHMSGNHNLKASICQLCGIGFDSPFNFQMHQCLKLEGPWTAIPEDIDSEAEQPVTPPPVTPPLVSPPPRLKLPNKDHPVCVCPECDFSSYDIGLVRVHMTRVHDISPSDCGRCGTISRDMASLTGHVCSGSGLNEALAKNPLRVTDPSKTPPRPVGGPLSKVPIDVDPGYGISPPVKRPRRKSAKVTNYYDWDRYINGGAVSTPSPEKQPEDRSSRAGYEINRSEIAESIESEISPSVKRPRRRSAQVTNYYDWDRYINGGEALKDRPKDGSDVFAKLKPEMSLEGWEQRRLQSETVHKVALRNNSDTAISTSENNADSQDSILVCMKCGVGGMTEIFLKMHICDDNVEASMVRES
ncbi:hypothetical protein AOL_s00076g68 [Orbilia oligospora ATCC 24927]|uniref:C2H2-type domain-containing protein n=1 Tax=Arthrobotrys oligospora (strain ATCC 24927 / CBS 115.81 / DSM 1491) TaxID=756982 RepID=G1X8W1_ARTOA|nr:hypothetical protein AOL_s00076g68 [Orbilia oligospora ATCC 24927]EGX50304.1 hypothetical protein AOL_s00076g68 [Orbilia oligospora ATCC 24927]